MSGTAVVAVSMLVFATLGPSAAVIVIIVALALSGLGNGIAAPSISASVANAVELEDMGSASAALQLASQVGVVAGIQIMETVQVARQGSVGVLASFHEAYVVAGCAALLGVVSAAFLRRSVPGSAPAFVAEAIIG